MPGSSVSGSALQMMCTGGAADVDKGYVGLYMHWALLKGFGRMTEGFCDLWIDQQFTQQAAPSWACCM